MQQNIKIIPLGGVEEIGINCTVFEYKDQIVVVDMGLAFPDETMYGVDYLVPNVDYLEKNKSKIEAIVVTHGHLDHIGALPYLLPRLDFPEIIGTEFTIELIKSKLEDHNLVHRAKYKVITPDSILHSGEFDLSFFRVNHSIPQCVGVVIKTAAATIVHTGDFKFDNSPINEPVADYARIAEIGKGGVDLLMSDSTNSLRKGHPISESEVADSLKDIVEQAPGRVIVASFSGLIGRLYQLIKVAEALNKKVAIAGYSMQRSFNIAKSIGYISPKKDVVVPIQRVNRYNDDRVIIITTGSQGEPNAALSRMTGEEGYKNIKLKKHDTVVLSAGTIPGNHLDVQTLIDLITDKDALVHQSESMDFFTSGHGYQEDQKIMLNLIKPKFFMPVHGYQYFLKAHAQTAMQVGLPEARILIAKRGNVVEGNHTDGFKFEGFVKSYPLLVSGTGVGDVGTSVLSERTQLGNYGVVVIQAHIGKEIDVRVFTKGFIYVKSSKDMLHSIKELSIKTIDKHLKKKSPHKDIVSDLEREIGRYANKELERDPVIIPMIS